MPELMARALLPLLILLALQQLGNAGLIKAKAGLAPLMLAKAWEQSLASQGRPVKPWPWADTWPVAKLQVPSMGISQFVLAGDTGNALAFGPGHNLASAALGGGGPCNDRRASRYPFSVSPTPQKGSANSVAVARRFVEALSGEANDC